MHALWSGRFVRARAGVSHTPRIASEWCDRRRMCGKGYAESVVARYYSGRRIPAFYNPLDPSEAVLGPGIPGRLYLRLGTGALVTMAGVVATVGLMAAS